AVQASGLLLITQYSSLITVFSAVLSMPKYISYLPHINATLNATSGLLLLAGFRFIRLGRIQSHRNCQVTAVITSTLFLVSYLTYHYFHGTTRFSGQGLV